MFLLNKLFIMTIGAMAIDNDSHIISLKPHYYKHTIT